jgi:hypothetical protein
MVNTMLGARNARRVSASVPSGITSASCVAICGDGCTGRRTSMSSGGRSPKAPRKSGSAWRTTRTNPGIPSRALSSDQMISSFLLLIACCARLRTDGTTRHGSAVNWHAKSMFVCCSTTRRNASASRSYCTGDVESTLRSESADQDGVQSAIEPRPGR